VIKFSDQALGAIMMALQKSLIEQTDIVPVLKGFDLILSGSPDEEEILILNPPTVRVDNNIGSDTAPDEEA